MATVMQCDILRSNSGDPIGNPRGTFLDLLLVADVANTQIFLPQIEDLMDSNTIHHNATMTVVTYQLQAAINNVKELNYATTNLRQTKVDIMSNVSDLPSQCDIDEAFFDFPRSMELKISGVTDTLRLIQDRHSKIKKHSIHGDSSNDVKLQSRPSYM